MPARPSSDRLAECLALAAALALALLFAARAMIPALSPDVVQDDARQYTFWTGRLHDPQLFRDDLIADYYQSLVAPGYAALYWAMTWVVDPLSATKLLPPLLGLAAALFTFLFVRRLHGSPPAALLAAALLSWQAWQGTALASASPRAFALPLLAAVLWSLAAHRLVLAVGLVALAALLFPVAAVLGVGLLGVRLPRHRGWRPLPPRRSDLLAFTVAAGILGALYLPGQLLPSRFGPLVSASEIYSAPEFGEGGRQDIRHRYGYLDPALELDLTGRAGWMLSTMIGSSVLFRYPAIPGLLFLLLVIRRGSTGVRRVSKDSVVLLQLLVVSLVLFCLAQPVMLHLYYPDRYVSSSHPLIFAAAGGLALGLLIETLRTRVTPTRRLLLAGALAGGASIALFVSSAGSDLRFIRDRHPDITAYLRSQPPDVLVAGAGGDTGSVPSLAGRRILASYEHALPFHPGYYRELRLRIEDLIEAYYAPSLRRVIDFADHYEVDIFLVNRLAFNERGFNSAWTGDPRYRWQPFTPMIARGVQQSRRPALLAAVRSCAAVDDGEVAAVPTACLRDLQT